MEDLDSTESDKKKSDDFITIDLNRAIEDNCEIKFLNFDEAKSHYWHSSSHILGSAIEQTYPDSLLTVGPSTKDGFFYDFYSPSG